MYPKTEALILKALNEGKYEFGFSDKIFIPSKSAGKFVTIEETIDVFVVNIYERCEVVKRHLFKPGETVKSATTTCLFTVESDELKKAITKVFDEFRLKSHASKDKAMVSILEEVL